MKEATYPTSKVVIVAAGLVGSTFAYSLMISGLAPEIVLIDVDREKCVAEAMDLNHGLPFVRPTIVRAGDYPDCRDAEIIVLTAGAAQKPGETRLELVKKNAAIMEDIVARIVSYTQRAMLLVVSNPVDVLTYVALKRSGFPPNRVMGSGTLLDSARFRYLLSHHCGIDSRNVHAYVIGEHGDSEVPAWSRVNIAGTPMETYCTLCGRGCGQQVRDRLFEQVKDSAYHIIERKGATYYAISLALVRIVESVLRNEHSVLTVSSLLNDYYGVDDVCLSVPTVVDRSGIVKVIQSPLSDLEIERFQQSAAVLKQAINELED